jgi:dihydrodipicolinate reductase
MAKIGMGVIGCGGRMGRMLVAEIAAGESCALVGGTAAPGSAHVGSDIGELAGIGRIGLVAGTAPGELIAASDVVIEFSRAAATAAHATLAAELDTPLVIGTTGLSAAEAAGRGVSLDEVAQRGRDGITGARKSGDIGFAALRGGDAVGDHHVIFAGAGESLELSHRATNRAIYAKGAVRAARWVVDQPPGLYSMKDVLGL